VWEAGEDGRLRHNWVSNAMHFDVYGVISRKGGEVNVFVRASGVRRRMSLHLHGHNMPEHRHPGTDSRGSTLGLDAPGGKPRTGGSVTVGAPIGVGTCPFEIWSRACSATCCILLSGAVKSATAHLPERFSHSLIKSSIALTIELAAAPAFATTALACLTAR